MCGIAGALTPDAGEARRAVEAMCAGMAARGPDDKGVALMDANGAALALGNRRLAIIDLSTDGHQPMSDRARGTTIVFNGMIYNFAELRARLAAEGETFTSQCDTEVVLKAYGRYGAACVRHLRGMFAFAIWDGRSGELFLARDRLGIKPLYYWQDGDRLLFASQVKALLATGWAPPRLSAAGIETYLAYGAVSEPLTAIEGVFALPAAHTATLRDGAMKLARYWDLPHQPQDGPSREEATRTLRELLEDTVSRHLLSDAPLGVFLSGGLDSSILAALAARQVSRLCAVSVLFDDPAFSEARYMDAVAAHLGAEHVRITLQPADLLDWLPDAFAAMDQPTFDGLNTYVVSRAAAGSGLRVALSGLGADELFDGYGHAGRVATLERARGLPAPVTALAGWTAGKLLQDSWKDKGSQWLSGRWARGTSYELLRRLFLPDEVARLLREPRGQSGLPHPAPVERGHDLFQQVSALELTNYTKNVLLRDTDAMSMAHSLEVRVPYLDHVLVEWAVNLPAAVKAGERKALLAAAVADLLPPEVLTRRKHGFALPLAGWMRGELRGEVDAALRDPPAALAALVDQQAMGAVWDDFTRDGSRWLRAWALYALGRWAASIRAGAAVIS